MQTDDDVSLPKPLPPKALQIGGLVSGVLPFFLSTTTVETVNGVVTSYRDTAAIGGGGFASLIGLVGLVLALRGTGQGRGVAIGLALASLALGALQLARGFGVFA